ncbi:hypothetical protein LTS18_012954 [Coniosporium uncinatum]|uniref:Uncharacterized protein n=1 Tax=Coniosporium uncinatum TaxID=93489 RepID=A0ACC3DC06_9PEZI|nr:hypothetical protein LTS18_012954 [Coniosporium uncinatum]
MTCALLYCKSKHAPKMNAATANNSNNSTTTPPSLSLLPPTSNPWLLTHGDLALYNPTLLLSALGLFQHTLVFGLIFLLRGFSARRALDLHFLTVLFALSFVFAPLIFLVDYLIDATKLFFFLEHEAIEYLITIRVLAPASWVRERSGAVLLLCWTGITVVTIVVAFNPEYKHGADVVAWAAFVSDFLVAVAGVMLVVRWAVSLISKRAVRMAAGGGRGGGYAHGMSAAEKFARRKMAAEAMGGLGFMIHGFTTMAVGPILIRVLYHGLGPAWFAYAWVLVFMSAMFVVALSVPAASIFFNTIQWCCWHDRKILPGQAQWDMDDIEEANEKPRRGRPAERMLSRLPYQDHPFSSSRERQISTTYWTKLAEKHAETLSPSLEDWNRRFQKSNIEDHAVREIG